MKQFCNLYYFISGSSSFVLGLFGTNNKFSYESVLARWNYISEKLKTRGITVCGFGSDGDSRYIKAQKELINFGKTYIKYGQKMLCQLQPKILVCQDPPHVCNKIKNRLFELGNYLTLGNFVANIGHLKILVNSVPKSMHKLNMEDIDSDDKMNFDCLKKICTENIFELLEKYVYI
jgi:hypothetical protein